MTLTSDIQGGINSNIDTVWFNQKKLQSNYNYTYEINSYDDFFKIIKKN